MSRISRHFNYVRYGAINRFVKPRVKYHQYQYDKDSIKRIEDFLSHHVSGAVLAFVGMRQAKCCLGFENPFHQIYDLVSHFASSVIVPTFTPSVRRSLLFDVSNTQSEVGAFSEEFRRIAEYRTLSPYKSYAATGPEVPSFKSLNHFDDFSNDGSYEYIRSKGFTTVNFGVYDLRLGLTHYAEYLSRVPYIKQASRDITIIDHNGDSLIVETADLTANGLRFKTNLSRIEHDLEKAGLSYSLRVNEFYLKVLPGQEYFDFLMCKLKSNPYYLVD